MGMPEFNHSGLSRCQAITDIFQSVALEQSALSYILYTEGEKLEKIMSKTSNDPEHILKTNESITEMVDSITMLEIVLRSKLNLFKDCMCDDCEEHHTNG